MPISSAALIASSTIRHAGIKVEKLTIDIEQMTAWCHRNGYEIDDKGRSVYGSVLLQSRDNPNALQAPVVDNTRVLQ